MVTRAVEVFCSAYIHAKYFSFLFLQQRKLVPSQISLVTMATASQPGGNAMVKKNVPMAQMNQKQHAVSSTQKCHSNQMFSELSNVLVFQTMVQAALSSVCFCL